MKCKTQQGVALVITLIMLSVITFMAVTFLVMSQRERTSVTGLTDQTIARFAADSAAERATAEVLASILAYTNPFALELRVSTNYINPYGFNPAQPDGQVWLTNVSYDASLTPAQLQLNIANLFYNPRPPVFITNRVTGSNEFRYYLDLNRNGLYDTNGYGPVLDNAGLSITINDSSGKPIPVTNFFVGDPEWIGLLERPEFPHSATNRFTARYAYFVLPAGRTLDLNYLHNQVLNTNLTAITGDGFLRNQGVGTWELNLAALLCDLNTNSWDPPFGQYQYLQPRQPAFPNNGPAFYDAFSLLTYRYATNYGSLDSAQRYFGVRASELETDLVDGYSDDVPLMTNTWLQVEGVTTPRDPVDRPWAGADNVNHFFTPQDLFDAAKLPRLTPMVPGFPERLTWAGTNVSSYDRYTFYRLLSQLGTDTGPEPAAKLNINHDSLVQRNPTNDAISATNLYPWRPQDFFTNAAIRLLANAGYSVGFGSSNILAIITNTPGVTNLHVQVYPTNFYTASVHRLLQLAANIHDATTSNVFPSVFRPVFAYNSALDQVFIDGYEEVTDPVPTLTAMTGIKDLLNTTERRGLLRYDMVYGVPLVIGAKKGFPNFNKFALETLVQVTRKLEFVRSNAIPNKFQGATNQMYIVGISNRFGIEAWNSYSKPYPGKLDVRVGADITAYLTDERSNAVLRVGQVNPFDGATNSFHFPPGPSTLMFVTNIPAGSWLGFIDPTHANVSFRIPLLTNWVHLTASTYRQATRQFEPLNDLFDPGFRVPHWSLNLRTRFQFLLLDTTSATNRIVDYVNLDSREVPIDITATLMNDRGCDGPGGGYQEDGGIGSILCTNYPPNPTNDIYPTHGIMNQLGVGLGVITRNVNWNSLTFQAPPGLDRSGAINFLRTNLLGWSPLPGQYSGPLFFTNRFYAPFSPTRNIYLLTSWQVNDPLVHYTITDLTDLKHPAHVELDTPKDSLVPKLGRVNDRYEPWTGELLSGSSSEMRFDMRLKDPLVSRSDDWDFPTNKFPNIGWLGRVHRGTPWQTVYLKSSAVDTQTWTTWTGNNLRVTNFGQIDTNLVPLYPANAYAARTYPTNFDSALTHPTNDWRIMDLFTTAPNENAGRGQLSVNQTNLAAWSAALSGVLVLTNTVTDAQFEEDPYRPPQYAARVIDPAGTDGTNSPLWRIVDAINRERTNTYAVATNPAGNYIHPNATFWHVGEILAVPELTERSPYLNLSPTQLTNGISDAVYERIPQQILSLLRVGEPRFVVYAFGQSLKPAERSIVTGGPFFGLCTNYQITAEVATRTVLRVEGSLDPQYTNDVRYPYPDPRGYWRLDPHGGFYPPRIVVESYNTLPPD